MLTGQVRIIGGKWRSRKISFPQIDEIRPTPDRVRETLFNWLSNRITGARCLDLFAGSGALSFEALSRGASYVMMFDRSIEVIRQLNKNSQLLGAQHCEIRRGNVPYCLAPNSADPFDIIFLDPPFHKHLIASSLQALENMNYLSRSSLLYIESELIKKDLSLPENWVTLNNKRAGQVNYYLLEKTGFKKGHSESED